MMSVTVECVIECDQQVNTSFEDSGCATPCHQLVNHHASLLLTVARLYSALS